MPTLSESQSNGTGPKPVVPQLNEYYKELLSSGKPLFKIPDRYQKEARPYRVICIGAGASGILLAYQFQYHMPDVEYCAYEKNPDITGTWYENTYPGCACDIPTHAYQFSFAPEPNMKKYYSDGPELSLYMKSVAKKFGLMKYFKVNHAVERCEWNAEEGKWHVTINNDGRIITDTCDVLINGSGVLNKWKWPDIPGLNDYKGALMHSAHWDSSFDYTNKTVAVIGGGSSGVQIVPAIEKDVKHMYVFLRSPVFIAGAFGAKHAGPNGSNFEYTEDQKKFFRDHPEEHKAYTKAIHQELYKRFRWLMIDSEEQQEAFDSARKDMWEKLKSKPELAEKLIPDFSFGCRRLTPGNGYLEALVKEHVEPTFDHIDRFTSKGIRTVTGKEYEVDAIMCATGFDTSFRPRFDIIGNNGVNLRDKWDGKTSDGYLGVAVDEFPNYFTVLGPNSPVGHGSLIPIMEQVSKYILRAVHKMRTSTIKSMVPKHEAVEDFKEFAESYMTRTAWAGTCSSWFKGGKKNGPVRAMWPGSGNSFMEAIDEVRWEDYDYTYEFKNRFAYIGTGFTKREMEGGDLSWFINEPHRLTLN
ncbi:hypothetical protein CANCADRAFT_70909 [Tortispora caseinolytica NRRL Y-17796]|uniref:FAD/NAD(P)-binding domain-containing protein n=1 Tax=Tortispora caseinolytica NRRL Y-17796 TaxID=767744 RepID=A0A1E4TI98_9ASCO|nr:hypothetical protein CANCADRAFT_70909 [Tortispora caseinolytica NRRL Y-17796]